MKDIKDYRKIFPEYEEMFSDSEVLDEEVKIAGAKADEEVEKIDPTNLPDGFESDPGLYSFLKKYAYAKPPEHLKGKVMKAVFKNEYKPKTTNNTNNTNNTNSYWNPFLVQNLRPLMYSFAGLFVIVLATIAYYQYTKANNSTNIIANQETPIIKVSPNPTDTPIATPSPIESIDPKVAINPNNDDNIRQDDTKEENNKQVITNQDIKPRKPEESKDLDKENDKIAMNIAPNNSSATRAVKELSNQQILTMKKLRTLRTIILDDSLEQDIRQEIEEEIENSSNWEIATDADAMFKVVDNKLMLVNQSGEILWFVNNHKTKYKSKVKYIKYIRSNVKYLSNLSNVKNKK